LLKVFLSREPLQLVRKKNGKDAIDIVRKRDDISFVLMDLKMPGTGGFKSSSEISQYFFAC